MVHIKTIINKVKVIIIVQLIIIAAHLKSRPQEMAISKIIVNFLRAVSMHKYIMVARLT
jgi:hypothetical protein